MARIDQDQRESLELRIGGLAEGLAASLGLEVVQVEVRPGGGRSVVRVYLDKAEGVALDDCERFSKRFSVVLDVEDALPFSYVLEVSSPGLDRRLVRERDYQRFVGRDVKVRTRHGRGGQRNFRGRLMTAQGGRIELEIAPGTAIEIALEDIEKANLVMEL